MTEVRATRDELGYVLCCHGRPMTCLECGEEYAAELEDVSALPAHQERTEPNDQACEALAFAAGAIMDAVGLEDGLDSRAGDAVIQMINTALVANGRQPMPQPKCDDDTGWFRQYLEDRLASLPAADAPDVRGAVKQLLADICADGGEERFISEGYDAHDRIVEGVVKLFRRAPARAAEWQPIETAPKDGRMLLLYPSSCWAEDTEFDYEVSYWDEDIAAFVQSAHPDDFAGFTHWMPLPLPPCALTGTKEPK